MSVDSGILSYDDPFLISLEKDGTFLAMVAGPGNLSERNRTTTLPEAVDLVLRVYRTRGRQAPISPASR
jgi:hypothetical protein